MSKDGVNVIFWSQRDCICLKLGVTSYLKNNCLELEGTY